MIRENAKSVSEKSGNFLIIAYILFKDNLSEIDASTSNTFNVTIFKSSLSPDKSSQSKESLKKSPSSSDQSLQIHKKITHENERKNKK